MKNNYLVDSNVWMSFFKKRDSAVDLISSLRENGRLFFPVLSVMELQAGWNDANADKYFPVLFRLAKVKDLSHEVFYYAGKLRRNYAKKGTVLQSIDTLIASTAIVNNMWMVTYNTRHFTPIKELKLYKGL